MGGAHGFTAWGQLVDDAYVEVAIERHGEGTGNGCGCHHQHVGRVRALAPELGTLGYAEAVLLIDDYETEACKLYRILDDGMGAHKNLDSTVEQSLQHFLTPLALHDTCQ